MDRRKFRRIAIELPVVLASVIEGFTVNISNMGFYILCKGKFALLEEVYAVVRFPFIRESSEYLTFMGWVSRMDDFEKIQGIAFVIDEGKTDAITMTKLDEFIELS